MAPDGATRSGGFTTARRCRYWWTGAHLCHSGLGQEKEETVDYPLCDHLSDYRAQFLRTETSYEELLAAVKRYQTQAASAEPEPGQASAPELAVALDTWRHETLRLRALLVELLREGRVVMPRGQGALPRCRACRCAIHRFEFRGWQEREDGSMHYCADEARSQPA